jgi:hypothetical protein
VNSAVWKRNRTRAENGEMKGSLMQRGTKVEMRGTSTRQGAKAK